MNWRSFGDSGLKVTELCLGTMTLAGQADANTSYAILDGAYEGGIRFLDTADGYPLPMRLATAGATERLVGRWLAERGVRDDFVLATKAYFPTGELPTQRGNSRLHLMRACEASLERLGTDRLDLFLCHGWDTTVPVEETLRALEDLKRAGKIVYVGVSNVRSHEVTRALAVSERLGLSGFDGLQPRYNLLQREAEESLFPLAAEFGLGTMVYNPIAGGLLSGKYVPGAEPLPGTRFALDGVSETYRRRYWDTDYLEVTAELKRLAEEHGMSLVTAAVAWVLANENVSSAIIGASKPDQLADHFRATEVELPAELVDRLDRVWYGLPRRPPELDTPRISDFYAVVS
jgi:aryl-alcohol dehydrogenase-like predicted oxidoreductase